MHIERKINGPTDTIELWEAEWETSRNGKPAKKKYLRRVGIEQPIRPEGEDPWNLAKAICWSTNRTLGNIAVFSDSVLGQFPGEHGADAILPCDIVGAGKFRHGPPRWWCRTHQAHWGTKADIKSCEESGVIQCSSNSQRMSYVVSPEEINIADYGEVGIWCSMPAAISTTPIESRPPRIHLHLRNNGGDKDKLVDGDYGAISLLYHQDLGLFINKEITRISITPPAALEFVLAIEQERELDCINCNRCGFPHLDLGEFARNPHKKHFCGNCGIDSVWSKTPIVSTPLKPLYDQLAKSKEYIVPERSININEYKDCDYRIWSSTPAVLWTAERAQEKGIHVHIDQDGKRIIDDTFGEVILGGGVLDRNVLLKNMLKNTVY